MTKSKQQIIDDGKMAERLLGDTDLDRFFEEMETECWAQFKSSTYSDTAAREAAYTRVAGIEAVRTYLRAMVDNGTIALKSK